MTCSEQGNLHTQPESTDSDMLRTADRQDSSVLHVKDDLDRDFFVNSEEKSESRNTNIVVSQLQNVFSEHNPNSSASAKPQSQPHNSTTHGLCMLTQANWGSHP